MDRSIAPAERHRARHTQLEIDRERDVLVLREVFRDRRLDELAIGMSQAEKLARLDRAAASLRP